MMNYLTVVMYHYVRDYKNTSYPGIKGMDVTEFVSQLKYFTRHYEFVTVEDCRNALRGNRILPGNAILLTFDDGYADHYEHVFPLLKSRDIQGLFFVPARPVLERVVLDVNKIHHVLACSQNPSELLGKLNDLIVKNSDKYGLKSPNDYAASIDCTSRYDTKEVILMKRLLQKELPLEARNSFTNELFAQYVTPDEDEFAKNFYLSIDQMRVMASEGMRFGHHGYTHQWLTTLPVHQRKLEIEMGLSLLQQIGTKTDNWVLSYPYGDYDDELAEMAKSSGCFLAFTSTPDIAVLSPENQMRLPRLDANDFPKEENVLPNAWTRKAVSLSVQ